jgi:hypothetical protein
LFQKLISSKDCFDEPLASSDEISREIPFSSEAIEVLEHVQSFEKERKWAKEKYEKVK